MNRRLASLFAALVVVTAACSSSGSSPSASAGASTASGAGCTVGVSWNNFQQPRWAAHDEPNLKKTIEDAGGKYISADANLISEQQLTDVDTLISQGAKVLILLAQDNKAVRNWRTHFFFLAALAWLRLVLFLWIRNRPDAAAHRHRDEADEGGVGDAQEAFLAQDASVEVVDRLAVGRYSGTRDRHLDGQHVCGNEAGIHGLDAPERADEEPGGDGRHADRHRHLRHHRGWRAGAGRGRSWRSAWLARSHVRTPAHPQRQEMTQIRGLSQVITVADQDADRRLARRWGNMTGTSRVSRVGGHGDRDPSGPAPGRREQQAFGQQLTHRAGSRPAPSAAHGRSVRRPRTRARSRLASWSPRDEQDRKLKAPKSAVGSSLVCGESRSATGSPLPRPEILLRVGAHSAARRSQVDFARGLVNRHTGLELGDHLEVVVPAVVVVRSLETRRASRPAWCGWGTRNPVASRR